MFTAISLCPGGGVGEGLGPVFKVVLGVECWDPAARTYIINYRSTIWQRDMSSPGVIKAAASRFSGVDVLLASTPCPWASTARDHEPSPKTLAKYKREKRCFLAIADWAEAIMPKAIIVENVKGVVKTREFRRLRSKLERLGYVVRWQVLNSQSYGTPQDRFRMFVVAIRKDIDDGSFRWPQPTHGEGLLPYVTAWDAICDLSEEEAMALGCMPLSPDLTWVIQAIPPGENWEWLLKTAGKCPGNKERLAYVVEKFKGRKPPKNAACRIRPADPCHTLRTGPSVQKKIVSVHPGLSQLKRRVRIPHDAPSDTLVCRPYRHLTHQLVHPGLLPGDRLARIDHDGPCKTLGTKPDRPGGHSAYHPGLHASAGWKWDRRTGNVQVLDVDGQYQPIRSRLLSVVEYRRIMGLPDSFRLVAGISPEDAYRIFGNGICPQVWRPLCLAVEKALGG